METTILEFKHPAEYNPEELNAYRSIGSVSQFRRLKKQEIRRRRLLDMLYTAVNCLLGVASIAVLTWIALSVADVLFNLACPTPVYASWNAFAFLL